MADSPQKTLSKLLSVLEKTHGKFHVLTDEQPLDLAVYLILREGWDYRKAARALHTLQREFVDWNEIRVTTPGELRSLLASLGDRDIDIKIEKIRTLLEQLYRDYNTVNLAVLNEMEEESQRKYLMSFGVLNASQVQILIQTLAADKPLVIPSSAIRVLNRVGIMPRVHSATAARKHAEELLEGGDPFAFNALLVQHGEDICLPRSPRCGECEIVSLCGFKRKVGVVAS